VRALIAVGAEIEARSRSSATHALARKMVDAGIADQPVEIWRNGRCALRYRSLHEMAKWTIEESATVPIRVARFRKIPISAVR
jgi:hypothetical protein